MNKNKLLIQEIFEEQNKLRTNPSSYIPLLETQMSYFEGKSRRIPNSNVLILTTEGKKAYTECINFLRTQKPVKALQLDEVLSKASQDHANDIGINGIVDHSGSDGSTMTSRVDKYLDWGICICENIDFGATKAEDILISLIVDDGVSNRGHRKNIFNDKIGYVGIGVSNHKVYEFCTVLDYVGSIEEYKRNVKEEKINKKNSDKKLEFLQKAIVNREKKLSVNTNLDNEFRNKMNFDNKINYHLQDDFDAPQGTVSCSIKVVTMKCGNKTTKKTTKSYKLADGSQQILEIEETEIGM